MSTKVRNPGWSSVRHSFLLVAMAMAIAFPALMLVNPLLALPAHASDNDKEVICPPPISEGETAHLQVRWQGHYSFRVAAFTLQDPESAGSEDFRTYDGVWMESAALSSTVQIPAVTKEDATPEPNETFSLGFYEDGQWHGCVITIVDDDMPEITNVAITSRPGEGLFYRYQENIDVTITLNKDVEVDGTPLMSLYIGDSDSWRGAAYRSGSGTNALTFRYQVQAVDVDHDGLSVSAAATEDNRDPAYGFSGKIYAKGTKAQIEYDHGGISNAEKHLVEGRPYVKSVGFVSSPPDGWKAYRTNQVVEVGYHFNTDVEVHGSVGVKLAVGYTDDNWDSAQRQANYLRGSGTDTLVFGYTVKPGDMDAKGIVIVGALLQSGFHGGGTITLKGSDAEAMPFFLGKDHSRRHKVDTEIPSISSVAIESRPGNGQAYAAGETISIAVVFSEEITIIGDPFLELDVGGVARQAMPQSNAPRSTSAQDRRFSNKIVFQYQVAEGDADSDGIGISANSLKLNGGGIYDGAGNAAGLSHTTVVADSSQKVGSST